jgi:HAD superfamily hydrolase (TIGR01484 family)
MKNKVLLCSDLDRTLLPNGPQEESEGARPLLRQLAARPEVTLVYVSGRHKALLLDAIRDYDIPVPDYAIGDVGTTIYHITDNDWHMWQAWHTEIAPDWNGQRHDQLAALLADIDVLQMQEDEKQNTFKLSYYAPEDIDRDTLLARVRERLEPQGIRASLIWSIDEIAHTGLFDVLPESATKLHAVRFLMRQIGFDESNTVFSGDSGNDLPVLTSGLQAVLVANAMDDVQREAREKLAAKELTQQLYLARGDFLGMNGNYAAGVLEGLAHFCPQVMPWLEKES